MSRLDLFGDWKRLKRMLDPRRAKQALIENVGMATRQNALIVQDAIKTEIRDGDFTKNAPLTVMNKGSSNTLIESGTMRQNVTHRIESPFEAIIGVLRGAVASNGTDLVNLAEALHEGYTYRVTQAVRDYFLFRHLRDPDIFKPLKNSTTVIKVPGRPFVRQAVENVAIINKVNNNWFQAVQRSFAL